MQVHQLRAPIKISKTEFRRVLTYLRTIEWVPAALTAELAFADAFELPHTSIPKSGLRSSAIQGSADVFRRGRELYYLIAGQSERNPYTELLIASEPSPVPSIGNKIEAGVFSYRDGDMSALLNEFTDAIEIAIRGVIDGRRVRHMDFTWSPPLKVGDKIDSLCRRLSEGDTEVRFDHPTLPNELVKLSEMLTDPATRALLRDISSARFALEQDIKRGRRGAATETALDKLASSELLRKSFLIQCRESSRPLIKIDNPESLGEDVTSLVCATCGRKFADELFVPGFALSESGRELSDHNHWMTVWTTKHLVDLGVPEGSILWNLEEGSDEIDIVVEFLGQLWILELKDRDVDPRDAHALNYRRVRYRPDLTIVITSGKVSHDARRVFTDLAEAQGSSGTVRFKLRPQKDLELGQVPLYIEGLTSVKSELRKALSTSVAQFAGSALRRVSSATGFDVIAAMNARAARSR